MSKKTKRRVIEHKPVPMTRRQRIQKIKEALQYLDEVEEHMKAELRARR